MKISVIIPVYNVEKHVYRCIESIIKQTMTKDVECIIINDATPDRSIDIIKEVLLHYDGNISFRIINHETNKGLAAARETGMKYAKGDYVIHIDSDDFCEINMLKEMYNIAITNDADIVIADYWLQYKDHATYISQNIPSTNEEIFKANLEDKIKGYNWNKLIKKELYTKNNIKYIEGINYGEDFLIALQLFYYAKRVSHIPNAFLHYVQYNSNSYSQSLSRQSLENIIFCETYLINFLQERELLNKYKQQVDFIRLRNLCQLIFRSTGKLQKEWTKPYKNLKISTLKQNKELVPSLYWRIALSCFLCGSLSLYNAMRSTWRYLRRKQSKTIILYQ